MKVRKSVHTRQHNKGAAARRKGALPRTPLRAGQGAVGTFKLTSASGKIQGLTGDYGANNKAKTIRIHTYSTPGNSPVTWV